jgi:predicted nucleic acid-binding protein
MTKIALDTNILIYNHFPEEKIKQDIANELLTVFPVISGQVVSEYLNVMKRSFPITKIDLINLCVQWMKKCIFHPVEITTLKIAEQFIRRYDFQLFDSIIVASAWEAGCHILYSEDMQHNQLIEEKLKIINPFL